MPRYIDADDAIYELKRAFSNDDFGKIIRCISRTPTADVVEIVRCKDCKHYWKNVEPDCGDGVAVCLVSSFDDAFCSEGERREDDG